MKRSLTPEEFKALQPRLRRMKPENVDAAYQVLVAGKTQLAMAEELGVTQQAIYDAVSTVWRHYAKDYEERNGIKIPPDWKKVTAVLPPEMAEVVTQMEKSAREKLMKEQR
ncbi:TrfB-related DNA-binding protein [Cupriavidus basilensis]|jgi:hypothetical protein|uniref:TrfB-related DNA-binding protein n=1 Tax=Cupriavidus basilensis TaxID=68895 RepID=UPI0023E7A8C3|nr:TrfB-related DNA-binding protein [Cupriavidus basilensis]MDF3889006.1 TrfB-related DNA-binding protein [Cupriavidus basilensis]